MTLLIDAQPSTFLSFRNPGKRKLRDQFSACYKIVDHDEQFDRPSWCELIGCTTAHER